MPAGRTTMPTLLVRATLVSSPRAGHAVPPDERDRFSRAVPHAEVVEIDANHLTVNTHPDLPAAVDVFLRSAPPDRRAFGVRSEP